MGGASGLSEVAALLLRSLPNKKPSKNKTKENTRSEPPVLKPPSEGSEAEAADVTVALAVDTACWSLDAPLTAVAMKVGWVGSTAISAAAGVSCAVTLLAGVGSASRVFEASACAGSVGAVVLLRVAVFLVFSDAVVVAAGEGMGASTCVELNALPLISDGTSFKPTL